MKLTQQLPKLLVLSLVLTLNGCLLTDEFKTELISNYNQEKYGSDEKGRFTKQEIEDNIADFKALKPDIARLIALESDLAYLSQTLKEQDKPSFIPSDETTTSEGLPELGELIVNQASTPIKNVTPSTSDVDKFSKAADASGNNKVKVQSAAPVMSVGDTSQTIAEVDAKFSNANAVNSRQNSMQPNASSSEQLVKFQPASSASIDSFSSDKCATSTSGTFAIHLASFSTMNSAKTGYKQLVEKYKDDICGLSPKVAEVKVRDKTFLSLRLGPIKTKDDAMQVCKQIKSQGDYCASAKFEGSTL
ncbi:SPOR domain-containing protein [Glaciecola sp. 1036]|uniref:SPOR domain-containing protein n=1 Tax=Alteromonadaceae TaxID=72275 RepID=UPI003D01D6FF